MNLMMKYATDISAILECVENSYQIYPFFDKWEIKWRKNDQSSTGATIREALANFKQHVVAKYIDPEIG